MRGSLGLIIGAALGAGGMYLALRPPWAGGGAVVSDAGVVAVAPVDAGSAKPPKKRHHGGGGGGGGAHPAAGGSDTDDSGPAEVVLTAADRALEWRGDDVALPPQNLDLAGGAKEARALDDSEIGATISAQAGGVRDCVVSGATGTDLTATITVKLLVDGAGRVTKSRVQAPHYLQDKGLAGCTKRAAGGMHFPATGAPTVVTLPITLG